jgi:hypothetical protein
MASLDLLRFPESGIVQDRGAHEQFGQHRYNANQHFPASFEHEDEHLVADFGVNSVERSAPLRLCGESSPRTRSPLLLLAIVPR